MLSDVHTVDVSYRRTRPWCPIDPWPFHSFMCCMWNSLSWPNHTRPSGSVAVWVIHAHHSRSMAVWCHTILSLFVLLDDWVNCLVWFIIFGTASLTFDQNNCMHCIFRLFCWTYQFPLTSCKIWVVKIHWVDVLDLDGSVCYKTKNVDLNSWAHYKGYCSGIEVFYSGLLLNYHTHHVIHVGFVVPRWGHVTCRWCCEMLGGSIILVMAQWQQKHSTTLIRLPLSMVRIDRLSIVAFMMTSLHRPVSAQSCCWPSCASCHWWSKACIEQATRSQYLPVCDPQHVAAAAQHSSDLLAHPLPLWIYCCQLPPPPPPGPLL